MYDIFLYIFAFKSVNMHTYYLLLGSNIGDKILHIENAITFISQQIGRISKESSKYRTEPWGLENQEDFINMVVQVSSDLSPEIVLDKIKVIEQQIGRIETEQWGPRVIDIDILYCDDVVLDTEKIKIPHPQIANRNFVLIPLIEIVGDMIDPMHNITIDEMYEKCTDSCEVYMYEDENEE